MHNFENFVKVKFRDILLTGTGHRDRRINRECPGQTGTYGRSNYKYASVRPHGNLRSPWIIDNNNFFAA